MVEKLSKQPRSLLFFKPPYHFSDKLQSEARKQNTHISCMDMFSCLATIFLRWREVLNVVFSRGRMRGPFLRLKIHYKVKAADTVSSLLCKLHWRASKPRSKHDLRNALKHVNCRLSSQKRRESSKHQTPIEHVRNDAA